MRTLILTAVFLFFSIIGKGQNLVPNPGFESYTTCPTASGQMNLAFPWTGTNYSTDYFNGCSSFISVTMPQNVGSYNLYPHTGNACSAIWTYNVPGNNYREYLKVLLNDTMAAGTCYYVSFYTHIIPMCSIQINSLSVHLSNDTLSSTGTGLVLNLSSDIGTFGSGYINDTLNWIKISGIYTASGNERAITIGNFKDDSSTDTIINSMGTYPGSYNFIDDVSIIPIDSIPGGLPAFAGNDLNIAPGESVFIGQEISNLYCNWYIGSTLIADSVSGLVVSPGETTTYTVEQNLCGTQTYDTVTVHVSGLGLDENNWAASILLYPNPNEGDFKIEIRDAEDSDVSLEIFDITGSLVYNMDLELSKEINPVGLTISNGVYFVHLINRTSLETSVRKLVVQK